MARTIQKWSIGRIRHGAEAKDLTGRRIFVSAGMRVEVISLSGDKLVVRPEGRLGNGEAFVIPRGLFLHTGDSSPTGGIPQW